MEQNNYPRTVSEMSLLGEIAKSTLELLICVQLLEYCRGVHVSYLTYSNFAMKVEASQFCQALWLHYADRFVSCKVVVKNYEDKIWQGRHRKTLPPSRCSLKSGSP